MTPVRVDVHHGDRAPLRPLFEMADDSAVLLDAYVDDGLVLVARHDDEPIGHLQLVATDDGDTVEIKNMAVLPAHRGTGIGRALVGHALDVARSERTRRMVVATGTADVGNLRFYQRLGLSDEGACRTATAERGRGPDRVHTAVVVVHARPWRNAATLG